MSWDRVTCVTALQQAIQRQLGETLTVFVKPPQTINPPCIVIARPTEVRFGLVAFGMDEADISVACVAQADGEDVVDELTAVVRAAIGNDPTLGGAVQLADDNAQRNWRNLNIAGADIVQAEVALTIRM
jgi:hypothetical protein